ncbi:MAG: hypothetical protein RI573_18330 [Balneolaceae bacterium]|nr:hypothetical protein [Balneolaceae bacterium]
MLSRREAVDLIRTEKIPETGSTLLFDINRVENAYLLKSKQDENIKFKLDFTQSRHVSLKLSCHHRDGSDFGLIRVDYNGPRHPNPQIASAKVPDFLKPYAGVEIPPRVNHVHIYVEGESLNWAMPLEDFSKLDDKQRDSVSVAQLEINSHNDKNKAAKSFADAINLQTDFSFSTGMMFN